MRTDKPSATARKVALNTVSLGAKPGMEKVLSPEVVDASARMLVASGAVGESAVRFARSRWAVRIYEAFDWMMPGQFEAFAHRRAFCEKQVRKGIEAGAIQVLTLGAGYDTLGWRLAPEFPEVAFFEIDHPATARLKAIGVANLGRRDNLRLISEDLGQRRLVDVLRNNSWEATAPSIVVAEGLLMYLTPAAGEDLFRQCAEVSGTGSRIAFTYVGIGDDGRPDAGPWSWLVLWLLKVSGEPWLWGIQPQELPRLLEETGWRALHEGGERHGVELFAVASRS